MENNIKPTFKENRNESSIREASFVLSINKIFQTPRFETDLENPIEINWQSEYKKYGIIAYLFDYFYDEVFGNANYFDLYKKFTQFSLRNENVYLNVGETLGYAELEQYFLFLENLATIISDYESGDIDAEIFEQQIIIEGQKYLPNQKILFLSIYRLVFKKSYTKISVSSEHVDLKDINLNANSEIDRVLPIVSDLINLQRLKFQTIGDIQKDKDEYRESVGEHVAAMTLFSIYFYEFLVSKGYRLDFRKLLQIIFYHDVSEAVFGDVPVVIKNSINSDLGDTIYTANNFISNRNNLREIARDSYKAYDDAKK